MISLLSRTIMLYLHNINILNNDRTYGIRYVAAFESGIIKANTLFFNEIKIVNPNYAS